MADGFYWIRNREGEWFIAECIDKSWQYPCTMIAVDWSDMHEVGPRIEPPMATATGG